MRRVTVFLSITLIPLLSNATDADTQRAKRAFTSGTEHFVKGEYERAADQFRASYRLKPSYKILYNIGQSEAAAKRYGISLHAFERYLAEGGDDIAPSRQEEVRREINRLRDMTGLLEVTGEEGATIVIDGVERGTYPTNTRLPVAAGVVHEVMAKNEDGSSTDTRRVEVMGGDVVAIDLTETETGPEQRDHEQPKALVDSVAQPEPPPPDAPRRTGSGRTLWISGIVLSGVGLAALAGGSICIGLAAAKEDKIKRNCDDGLCDPRYKNLVDARDRLVHSSTILWATGGAIAASGVAMMLVAKLRNRSKETSEMSVVPALGGVLMTGAF